MLKLLMGFITLDAPKTIDAIPDHSQNQDLISTDISPITSIAEAEALVKTFSTQFYSGLAIKRSELNEALVKLDPYYNEVNIRGTIGEIRRIQQLKDFLFAFYTSKGLES
jgi:glutaredoxin-related protein